jgi:hypothetical protein
MKYILTLLAITIFSSNSFACKDEIVCGDAFGNQVVSCLSDSPSFSLVNENSAISEIKAIGKTKRLVKVKKDCESKVATFNQDFKINFKMGTVKTRTFICEELLACE